MMYKTAVTETYQSKDQFRNGMWIVALNTWNITYVTQACKKLTHEMRY